MRRSPNSVHFLYETSRVFLLSNGRFKSFVAKDPVNERKLPICDIRRAVYDRVVAMSPEFYEKLMTGEVLSRNAFNSGGHIDVVFNDPNGVGLDTTKILDTSAEFDLKINGQDASSVGVSVVGTPIWYVNGMQYSGAQPYENVIGVIDEALEEAREGSGDTAEDAPAP